MSEMKILPIEGKCFGARIENVNVRSLEDAELESIKAAFLQFGFLIFPGQHLNCLLYTSPSPRDLSTSRMPSSA